ncbi:MAG: Type II secretion system protein E [Desulfonauticus sp. 38_4375]|nr:MAG: Type II secretion system protein E [Desulfonauticus sp. 38_4375]
MALINKKIGEILVEEGLISQGELENILKNPPKEKLGEYLISLGLIKEKDLAQVLSKQTGLPIFDPHKFPIDPALAQILPLDLVQKHKVIPLKLQGRILTLGMVDPLDMEAVDAIEIYTNKEVDPVVCTPTQFEQITATLYGSKKELDEIAEEAPVVRLVNSILSQAIKERASDVHFSPERDHVQLRFRIDGTLYERPAPPRKMFLAIASRIKILANMDIANTRIPQDGRFTIRLENKEINVRVSSLPTIYGENIVLRLLDMNRNISSLEELGMELEDQEKIKKIILNPYGMILATGPTGSGKSTTLYAILSLINKPDINIITLEDPVEYRMASVRQVQLNRKAGMTFASGLRSILRQDPDVIMVGEIRDLETAQIATQAALTGHKLLSTIHTNDAASAITRFIDMGIEPFLVASSLLVSIAQRLVRKICPYCQEEYSPDPKIIRYLGLDKEPISFKRGKGCIQCHHTGFIGRIGVYEILINDEEVQEMTLKNLSSKQITRQLVQEGKLRTLQQDVLNKVKKGITTPEEALKVFIA